MPLDAKKSLSNHVVQADLDSNDEEMRDVQQKRLEEQEVILEIMNFFNITFIVEQSHITNQVN
jgi:hypothetical protein